MVGPPVLFSKRQLLVGLIICAVLQLLSFRSRRITRAFAAVPVDASGSFKPDGQYPGEQLDAVGVRVWGSWSGSDDNTGSITIGPFPAPRILRFAIGGYPDHDGNTLSVERLDLKTSLAIPHAAVGERWQIVDCELPHDWVGHLVRIVATDAATGLGGWLALSEPLRGGRGDGNNALLESFAAWAINGVALGLIFAAAVPPLAQCTWLPRPWVPLAAGAAVAAAGYLTFWAYFAGPLLGRIFSWAWLLAGGVLTLRPASFPRNARPSSSVGEPARREVSLVLKLMLAVGAFHLALLHLFPSSHDFYTLAANRYREALPIDNALPHLLAARLFAGQPAKNLSDEWRSSDRPPLESGWQLLTWPLGQKLSLDARVASGTAAIWFQLLWVPAAYGLLRSLGVARRRAAGWIAACALGGFFVQNTIYTWPKLSAGAFACGAFALWLLPALEPNRPARIIAGAVLALLAWLSHGGVAFSFLALLPWILWRAARGELRSWCGAAVVFLVAALPWLAYQKFYDPPGNRLLKWHLAGQRDVDARGTWQTLRESYHAKPWAEILANKASNFQAQITGDFFGLFDLSFATHVERRNEEFFGPWRGLSWWPFLALGAVVISRRRVFRGDEGALLTLGAWSALTTVIWCLLLFDPFQAVIHQGSYALMIALFIFFSVILERASAWWLMILAGLQAITLGTTWAVSNPVTHGPATGIGVVIAGAAVLAWFIAASYRRSSLHENEPADFNAMRTGPET